MSTPDDQATRQVPFQGPGAAQRQQRSAESDHGRKPDEEKNGKQEKDDGPKRPDLWKKFAAALPLIFGVGFCVAFFVWVCLQMAGQTVGGPPLLLGIFGGAILGIAAAALGAGAARLGSSSDKSED
jgi:hypothetical protein